MRLIDLSNNKFFYRKNVGCCGSTTTALLIAKQPIQEDFAKIDNTDNIVGCCGESCTKLLQQYGQYPCPEQAENCLFFGHTIKYTRYGCEDAASGSCSESSMLRSKDSVCENIYGECGCEPDGEWISTHMQACS